MVNATATCLKVDLTPLMRQGKGSSPSPKISQAFLNSTEISWLTSPSPKEATLQSELRGSFCPSPLHVLAPPSPLPFGSYMRGKVAASPRAQGIAPCVPNFYEVLGLPQDVGLPDIKAAYRQMARQYHPDVCGKEECVEESTRRFIAVQEAYETLSDPRKRASYDRGLPLGMEFSRRGWAVHEEGSNGWKLHWQDQLFNMKMRNERHGANGPDSWGSRMRRQQKQQEGQEREFASQC